MRRIFSLVILIIISISLFYYVFWPKRNLIKYKIIQNTNTIEDIKEFINPQPSVILSNGLPDKILLKTAFIPQAPEKNWAQPWQDACEEAALLTVKYYYLQTVPTTQEIIDQLKQIFSFEEENGWGNDINISQMASISSSLFKLNPEIISNPNLNDIKTYIAQKIPVIINANGKTLFKENPHFKAGGPWYHSLVIIGYDDTRQQFIVHDVGTQFGAYYRYSYSLLIQSIHDFPASHIKEDIDSGEIKVLVLIK